MKHLNILLTAVALVAAAVCVSAGETAEPRCIHKNCANKECKDGKSGNAVKEHLQNHFKFYGFIRNYMPFDTRESYAGTGDLYYWIPKDNDWNTPDETNPDRQDLNQKCGFKMLAITSRLGVDLSGYQVGDVQFGAKVEADFFVGLTGSTGTAQLRLRQAFATLKWVNPKDSNYSIGLKAGQAWHPMAADLPDIFALDSGMPFGPFSRTPQLTADFNLAKGFTLTAGAIWQMQFTSMGPSVTYKPDGSVDKISAAASADYMKYGIIPEFYFGLSYKHGGFLGRLGMDVSSIRPRSIGCVNGLEMKAKDRKTSVLGFMYLQYTKDLFKFKAKTVYGGSGEHINLESGYAVCDMSDPLNWKYTSINTSDTWVTLAYGKKVQGAILFGYMKNLGTSKDIISKAEGAGDGSYIFFQKNGSANISQMFRIEPEITYNIGKFTIGLQYMLTGVQYGDKKYTLRALPTENLHWVLNHRVEGLIKFTF